MGDKIKKLQLPLIVSPFTSQLGTSIYLIGLDWLIVHATGSTNLLGIIQGIGGFAFLFGDVLVGVLVDHLNRKRVLVWSDLIAAAACVLGGLTIDNNHPQTVLLIMVTLVLNLMGAINYPAAKAIIPEVIEPLKLQRFNAATNTLYSFANIGAPIIGGSLLAIHSIDFTTFMIVNAFSFILGAVLNSFIFYVTKPHRGDSNKTIRDLIIGDTIDGLKYVIHHIKIIQLMIAMGIFNFVLAGFLLASPYISQHSFSHYPHSYSVFLTIGAVGGALGGLRLMLQSKRVKAVNVYVEQLTAGVILVVCTIFFSYPTWLIIGFTIGLIQARLFGSITTLIQDETEISYLGRIFGLLFLFFDGIQPLGSILFGYTIPLTGPRTYLEMGMILVVLFGIMIYWNSKTKPAD